MKTTVKDVHDKLAMVLARGKDLPCYIMISGTRYPVNVITEGSEVYLVPRRDKPVSFNPMRTVSPTAGEGDVA